MTNQEMSAINFIFEKILSKRIKNMIPNYEDLFLFHDIPECINNENEAKEIIEGINIRERKEFLYDCIEACNYKTNDWLLHHSLLPIVVGTKFLQDETDYVLCKKLLKIEDIFFNQNLLSCVLVDNIFIDNSIGLFLIVGEEYENLLNKINNNDREKLFQYPYVHFEISYDSSDVTITFNYKALEFLFNSIDSISFLQLTKLIRFDKYDGYLNIKYKEILRNEYDQYKGGTLLELECIRI